MRDTLRRTVFTGLLIIFLLSLSCGTARGHDHEFDFFTLFDMHGAIMLLIEVESGAIVRANDAAAAFYGYPRYVLETMTIQQINMLSAEDIDQASQAAAAEQRNNFVFPHRVADGTIRTVEVYSYPFLHGDVPMLFSVIHDITDQVALELRLVQSLAGLKRAERITGLGHWEFHLPSGIFTLSDGAKLILGLTGVSWKPEEIEAIVLPQYRTMRNDALMGLIHRNEPYDLRFRIQRPNDGRIVYIHSMAEYKPEENKIFGVIHDISATELKLALIRRQQNIITYSLLVFILMLLTAVFYLGWNIRHRRRAQASLKNRLQFEQLITEISTSFVSSTADNLRAKIEAMLALVGSKLGVDRCSLLEFTPAGDSITINHEWNREGIAPHKQHFVNIDLLQYPWLADRSQNREYIFIPDVEKLPEEAAAEKAEFQRQGVRGILSIPILISDRLIAHLAFDLSEENRHWSEEEIAFLGVLANILSDALEKCKMENTLFSEKERLRITLSSVGDGVITTDRQGRVESINHVAQGFTGWTEAEAAGKPFQEIFQIVHEQTREPVEDPVTRVLNTGQISGLTDDTLLIAKDGRELAIADSAAPILDSQGNSHGVVLVFRDVTEERSNIKKIEYLSFHDQLTGLYNRRFFEAELKRLDTPRNLPLSIVMTDVNGLKLTNDAFGHATGDALLQKAAEVLKGQCRADDIIARIGGDEFVLLLPRTGLMETEQIVKRIRAKAGETSVGAVILSISIGWAQKDAPEMAVAEVLRQAENQMYRRKLFESQSMRGTTVQTIIRTLHEKNIQEEQHSRVVSRLSAEIGKAMGLEDKIIDDLSNTGTLHDIGKIAVPDVIINKRGRLTADEWKEIQRHPEVGYHILRSVDYMAEMAEFVLAHHERWDGQGYPKRLRQQDIPLQARIIAVADAYEAMVSQRPYRNAYTKAEALDELNRHAGTQFDPDIVKIFLTVAGSMRGTLE